MRICLPDVNVLIALHDSTHPAHLVAHNWFQSSGNLSWATCPLSENGFIRITAQTLLKGRLDGVSVAFFLLEKTKQVYSQTYHFWSDSVSLSDVELFVIPNILGHNNITDSYLLGLCQKNNGTFVTLDYRVTTSAILSPHSELLHILK